MTPEEQIKLDEFLTENLCKEYIQPSKSSMASPFFFVSKKDSNKLRPCQDYQWLNEGTIKNIYSLSRIGDLLDKLKGAKYFTKLDLRWGYNNVRIRQGDEWKAAFKTNQGLFKPLVMFFRLCNSPATFQNMMNDIFRDKINEGWILIYMDDILIFAKDEQITTTDASSLGKALKEWPPLKPQQMRFQRWRSQIPQNDHQGKPDSHRTNEVSRNPRLAHTLYCKASPILPRIQQFLQKIHWPLLQVGQTLEQSYKKGQSLGMVTWLPGSVQCFEARIPKSTSITHAQLQQTIYPWVRCL